MVANVETYVGREAAWHRLGEVKGRSMTVAEGLTDGKLRDWNVRTSPLFTAPDYLVPDDGGINAADLGLVHLADNASIIRDNPFVPGQIDVLGVSGAGYTPIQNETAFGLAEAIVDTSDALVDTVVSMDGGKQVAMVMRMPEGVTIGKADRHDLYLAICTSHDGSMALHAFPTAVRIVCQNTFKMALHSRDKASTYKVRHTASSKALVNAAREALSVGFSWGEELAEMGNLLLDTKMVDREFDALVAKEFAVVSTADTQRVQASRKEDQVILRDLFTKADTQDYGRGTRWAAFNALTEWSEWIRPRGDVNGEKQSKSVIFGNTAIVRQRAWNTLTADLVTADA